MKQSLQHQIVYNSNTNGSNNLKLTQSCLHSDSMITDNFSFKRLQIKIPNLIGEIKCTHLDQNKCHKDDVRREC